MLLVRYSSSRILRIHDESYMRAHFCIVRVYVIRIMRVACRVVVLYDYVLVLVS